MRYGQCLAGDLPQATSLDSFDPPRRGVLKKPWRNPMSYEPNYEPNYEQRQKINSAEAALFEQILWKIHEGEVDSIDKARKAL
jgi:hypothetical protein